MEVTPWRVRRAVRIGAAGSFFFVLTLLAGCEGGSSPQPTPPVSAPRSATAAATTGTSATQPSSGGKTPAACPGAALLPAAFGREVVSPPDLPEPPPRARWADPTFGTCIARVTDRLADLTPGDPSAGLRHEYARIQAFNADGTRILLQGTEGRHYLFDAATLEPLGEVPLGSEPRWHDADPHLLFSVDGTTLTAHRLDTATTTVVHDFAADLPGHDPVAVWTNWEGSPSTDRRWWGLMAEDGDWLPTAFLVYDLTTDQVAVRDLRDLPAAADDVDHVTMSPGGTSFLASFDRACEPGVLGRDAAPCGLMAYGRDLTGGRGLLRVAGHYDTALDPAGAEVVVYQDVDTDEISMIDIATGVVTPLLPIDFSHTAIGIHISGLAVDRPGWAVVSTHDDDAESHTWIDDQVLAVELRAGGRVIRLAHTHSLVDDDEAADYWAEPHATTDPGLTRILFASNWGRTGTGAVDAYLAVLPDGAIPTP